MHRNGIGSLPLTLTALIGLLASLAGCRAPDSAARPEAAAAAPVAAAAAGQAPSDPAQPWWQGRVFYEIFVRSFADSTSGPLADDGIGDFAGLIEKLDYLNDGDPATTTDLGITGIWLMPINPSPSYHGYDVTDYYGVNPQFGTRADFVRFMAECRKRDIKVIVDLVLNHSSSDHPFFQKALAGDPEYRDWYTFVPANEVPTYLGPWNQQVWQKMQDQWYYGIFWSGMPDLNYRNPEVTAEARRVAKFWLEEMGVDGFRLDAIRHLIEDGEVMSDTPETRAWLQDNQRYLRSVRPSAITVGEVWTNTEAVAEYVHEGSLDLAFEFDLGKALLDAAFTGTKDKLDYTLQNVSAAYPDYRFASILTNHDQDRVINEMRGDVNKARLAASLLLTAPGLPFLYYGEEIGQPGAKPDEMIRNPMPWTGGPHGGFTRAAKPWERLQKGFETRNVAAQDADPDSLLNHYRRMIRLRQAEPALARGSYAHVETGRNDLIAWSREHAGRQLLVLGNLGGTAITDWAPPAGLKLGRELTAAGSVGAIPARTVLVYEIAPAS